jgi:hypothetical protein
MIEITQYVAKTQTHEFPPGTYYYDPVRDSMYSRHHAALWEKKPKKGRIAKNWNLSGLHRAEIYVSANYLRAQLHDQIQTLVQRAKA